MGHLPETAFPDEPGNVALAGHRDSVFRPLQDLLLGDTVILTTPFGVFTYEVETIAIVPPGRTDVVARGRENALTLVTCHPFHYIGAAPDRFVARARPTRPSGEKAAARYGPS